MSDSNGTDNATPQRPKLVLKPRDPSVAARIDQERAQSATKSPFGAAKPRELVIASREGKSEEDILRDEIKKEKLHLRLNAAQLEEKRAHEAAVKEIQDQIESEEDAAKKEVLRVELAARETKLNSLMERFAKVTLEAAMSGEAPRVSQMRKQQMDAAAAAAAAAGGIPPYHHQAPHQPQHYNPRYNPTQQYAGQNHPQRSGYHQPRGGYDHYNAGGRNYVPRGGRTGGRPNGGGGRYGNAIPGGGGGPRGYGDTSDAGFFDQPGGGYATTSNRGRGGARGGRGGNGEYYDAFNPSGYSSGGRGVGGEIDFDTFSGQDRY